MKTSIIIPIYNKKEYTQKCLESIFEFGSANPFEIIVVDNNSTDGSAEYIKSLGKEIVQIRNNKNLGFAKACNQGARVAKGEYVLFLNNDTVVTKGWADVLVKELDADKTLAVVGSKLLYPDGTVQHAGVVFDDRKWPHHIYKKESADAAYVNKQRKFQALTGACMLVRKDMFDRVGGFDEQYVNGLEDLDLCLKIKELGFGILYCPESVVYHHESVSAGRSNFDEKNVKLFYSRWKDKIEIDYKKYLNEDNMTGMGEFLDVWTSKKLSLRKIRHLIKRFIVTGRRDGFMRAIKKGWFRLVNN